MADRLDFTTTIAVDRAHLDELRVAYPTWVRDRPEILEQPLMVLFDGVCPTETPCFNHPHVTFVVVPTPSCGGSQRDKMLTSFVLTAPRYVESPWILKLDCDTVSVRRVEGWCAAALARPDEKGTRPVLISQRWGYSRPATAIRTLDDWADGVPGLRPYPRLDLPYDPSARSVGTPGRIISWCCFTDTGWARWAAGLFGDRLPVPSHDTTLSFLALRRGDLIRRVDMKALGWRHVGRQQLLATAGGSRA